MTFTLFLQNFFWQKWKDNSEKVCKPKFYVTCINIFFTNSSIFIDFITVLRFFIESTYVPVFDNLKKYLPRGVNIKSFILTLNML